MGANNVRGGPFVQGTGEGYRRRNPVPAAPVNYLSMANLSALAEGSTFKQFWTNVKFTVTCAALRGTPKQLRIEFPIPVERQGPKTWGPITVIVDLAATKTVFGFQVRRPN